MDLHILLMHPTRNVSTGRHLAQMKYLNLPPTPFHKTLISVACNCQTFSVQAEIFPVICLPQAKYFSESSSKISPAIWRMNLGKTSVSLILRKALPALSRSSEASKQGFQALKGSTELYPRSGCAAALEICPQSKRDVPKPSSSHSAVSVHQPLSHPCVERKSLCSHKASSHSKPPLGIYSTIYKERSMLKMFWDTGTSCLLCRLQWTEAAEFRRPELAAGQYGPADFGERQKGERNLP